MKELILIVAGFFVAGNVHATKQKSCRDGYVSVSCTEVAGAQREKFCWKGKMTAEKLEKFCKKPKRKKQKT